LLIDNSVKIYYLTAIISRLIACGLILLCVVGTDRCGTTIHPANVYWSWNAGKHYWT